LFELLDAPFQIHYVLFQALYMVGMETFVFRLVQSELAHEFAEIIEALFYPPEARVGLIQPPIGLI